MELINKKNKVPERITQNDWNIVFNNAKQHGIFIMDKEGCIIKWNKTAETLTKYTDVEMIGQSFLMLFSKNSVTKKTINKYIVDSIENCSTRFDVLCTKKDNLFFWGEFFINPIIHQKGIANLFLVIFQDITEKRKREMEKDEYIGVASHELRTPVTALSLYSELLSQQPSVINDKDTKKIFNDMKGQIKRVINLIDDLLVVNEIERKKLTLNKKSFKIDIFIKRILNEFKATTIGHNLVFKGRGDGLVYGDENRLTQVLVNIIGNAIKYSPPSSKVIIKVECQKRKVIVSVQDFGIGIGVKEKAKIFKRYFRSYSLDKGNLPGLGLGLYISREIIRNHNEKIWLKSKKGNGSTFYFTISRPSL